MPPVINKGSVDDKDKRKAPSPVLLRVEGEVVGGGATAATTATCKDRDQGTQDNEDGDQENGKRAATRNGETEKDPQAELSQKRTENKEHLLPQQNDSQDDEEEDREVEMLTSSLTSSEVTFTSLVASASFIATASFINAASDSVVPTASPDTTASSVSTSSTCTAASLVSTTSSDTTASSVSTSSTCTAASLVSTTSLDTTASSVAATLSSTPGTNVITTTSNLASALSSAAKSCDTTTSSVTATSSPNSGSNAITTISAQPHLSTAATSAFVPVTSTADRELRPPVDLNRYLLSASPTQSELMNCDVFSPEPELPSPPRFSHLTLFSPPVTVSVPNYRSFCFAPTGASASTSSVNTETRTSLSYKYFEDEGTDDEGTNVDSTSGSSFETGDSAWTRARRSDSEAATMETSEAEGSLPSERKKGMLRYSDLSSLTGESANTRTRSSGTEAATIETNGVEAEGSSLIKRKENKDASQESAVVGESSQQRETGGSQEKPSGAQWKGSSLHGRSITGNRNDDTDTLQEPAAGVESSNERATEGSEEKNPRDEMGPSDATSSEAADLADSLSESTDDYNPPRLFQWSRRRRRRNNHASLSDTRPRSLTDESVPDMPPATDIQSATGIPPATGGSLFMPLSSGIPQATIGSLSEISPEGKPTSMGGSLFMPPATGILQATLGSLSEMPSEAGIPPATSGPFHKPPATGGSFHKPPATGGSFHMPPATRRCWFDMASDTDDDDDDDDFSGTPALIHEITSALGAFNAEYFTGRIPVTRSERDRLIAPADAVLGNLPQRYTAAQSAVSAASRWAVSLGGATSSRRDTASRGATPSRETDPSRETALLGEVAASGEAAACNCEKTSVEHEVFARNWEKTSGVLMVGDSPSRQRRAKKSVSFADQRGLDLVEVRILYESDDEDDEDVASWSVPYLSGAGRNEARGGDEDGGGSGSSSSSNNNSNNSNNSDSSNDDNSSIAFFLTFEQPCIHYKQFRERVERDKVSLENVVLRENQRVWGTIKVKNLCYEKHVFVRHTTDSWRSSSDVPARHVPGSGSIDLDQFSFEFQVPGEGARVVEFAVCLHAEGCQYWDNNGGANYCIQGRRCESGRSPCLVQSYDQAIRNVQTLEEVWNSMDNHSHHYY